MAFWNRSKNGITDEQRLAVLNLATDEDFALQEVAQKFSDLQTAQAVVADLRERKMLEFFWKRPKGGREEISSEEVSALIEDDSHWGKEKSFSDSYVIVVANDKGWRWHQSHWKSKN